MKGYIDNILERKTKDNKEFHIVAIDGQEYSCWEADLLVGISQGQAVEFEFKQSGKYKNITGIKVVTNSDQLPPKTSRYDDTKIWNTCLMCAKDIVVALINTGGGKAAGMIDVDITTIKMAQAFYQASEENQEPDFTDPAQREGPESTQYEDLKKMLEETEWTEEADIDHWLVEQQEAIQKCTTGQQRVLLAVTDKEKNKLMK